VTGRRGYDSPLRRRQAEQTRERILTAGSELVHRFPSWDWGDLTFRAVAERAGVGERTVYRYFPTQRDLHDAVMARLEHEAGVTYDDLAMDTVASVASRVFASLGSFAVEPTAAGPDNSSFSAEDDRRRQALRRVVSEAAPHWSDGRRDAAAAALDVLWSVPSYERLVVSWKLDHEEAADVVAWLIGVVAQAIEDDNPPRMGGTRTSG
jgi:AcrR family transcriptional regulator